MPEVVVDTSPLQYLHRLKLLDLLRHQYGNVVVPEAVVREIQSGAALAADVPDISVLAWIHEQTVAASSVRKVLATLGRGEREVIALALHKVEPLVVLDDRQARREAKRLSIRCTGVLGILLKAKQGGRIGQLVPLLNELQRRGFYLDATTRSTVLQLAGERP